MTHTNIIAINVRLHGTTTFPRKTVPRQKRGVSRERGGMDVEDNKKDAYGSAKRRLRIALASTMHAMARKGRGAHSKVGWQGRSPTACQAAIGACIVLLSFL